MKTDSEKLNDMFKEIELEFKKFKNQNPMTGSISSAPISRLYIRSLEILGS